MERFDYVIVGAGSSGCVLANRLSKDSAKSVLLIEAGPADNTFLISMPRGIGKLHNPKYPHVKFYQASRGGNRANEVWYKGSTIGGSSSINGMVYVRGAPLDYDSWKAAGCTEWGWDNIGRCYTELEDHELGADEVAVRGAGGPLKVSVHAVKSPLTEALMEAGVQFGIQRTDDVNSVNVVRDGGIGYNCQTTHKGQRFSAARAFLDPVKNRANLKIVTGTAVRRIVFDGNRAVGLEVRDASGDRTINVDGEIILSAGAIESPKLLQLSGIGPKGLLEGFGIPVLVDSPDVGRNLREHRVFAMRYRLRGRGSNNRDLRGGGLIRSVLNYFVFRKGALTHTAHEAVAFLKSRRDLDHADVQVGFGLFTMSMGKAGYEIEREPGLTVFAYFTRPESQGTIRLASADPAEAPMIDANYFDAAIDRERGIDMVRRVRELMNQPALKPYVVGEVTPGAAVQTDEEILDALIERGGTAYHVAGTCRMGADEGSVVDGELRVRGVLGLRVCDTSIFPTLVSGNTNGPAMVVAQRLSELMA
ncbi:choline dehydrogenase-like flavoprotein [Novosphingobium hassiacum]|uniref:Choline dehydrogenase-like flavoprotein n=1 Tax=Novosphingobium hassiacum TaxID=173676 RepID=A0A7W5ZW00_9SPHN|nr:choline dehydrogenase-like flavoprotein [Novosphingobium hassiacum]